MLWSRLLESDFSFPVLSPILEKHMLGLILSAAFVVWWLLRRFGPDAPFIVAIVCFGMFWWFGMKNELLPYSVTEDDEPPSPVQVQHDVNVKQTTRSRYRVNFYKGIDDVLSIFAKFKLNEIGSFNTLVTLLDRFFSLYELIMMDKLPCSDIQRMHDIKNDILNTAHTFIFNVSSRHTNTITETTAELHMLLFNYVKIVKRKCKDNLEGVEEGLLNGYDPNKSPHDLF
jgi:hypothetical protein